MSKNEFAQILSGIHAAYAAEKITGSKTTVELWWQMLKDMPYVVAAKNLEQHVKKCKYPPTIAEIRKEQPRGFNNFIGRNYDMVQLERALLGVDRPGEIETNVGVKTLGE